MREKTLRGVRPLLREKLSENDLSPSKNADFQAVFTRSASAVTPSERSSINTNRKFTMSFTVSLRWRVHVRCPESPNRGHKRKV